MAPFPIYIIRNWLSVFMLALDIIKPRANQVLVHREFLVPLFPSEEKQLDRSFSRMWKAWCKAVSLPTLYLNIQD